MGEWSRLRGAARSAVRMPAVDAALGAVASALERALGPSASGLAALTYHRVDDPAARPWLYPGLVSATPEAFEAQAAFLARHYRVVSLAELLEIRRSRRVPRERLVMITFDDGYRDVAANAWPILRRHGLPATLFVPTALIGTSASFWWDRLWAALHGAPRTSLSTPIGSIDLRHQDRRVVFRSWRAVLKAMPDDELERTVDRTCEALDAAGRGTHGERHGEGPGAGEPPPLLDWDEVATLAADGLAIGAHTRTHPLLTRVPTPRLNDELVGSRQDLESRLGGVVTAMAYPSGAHDASVVAAAGAAGYELAFTTTAGIDDPSRIDWLRIRRTNVGAASSLSVVRLRLARSGPRRTRGRRRRAD
jgi:peptidoglycan/xylan/chitin deacetylase (PgdA/CDA1 family)